MTKIVCKYFIFLEFLVQQSGVSASLVDVRKKNGNLEFSGNNCYTCAP